MPSWLLMLTLTAQAADQAPRAVWGERVMSAHAYMSQAYSIGKRWDPEAKLLQISGTGPTATDRLANHEVWTFFFGAEDRPGIYYAVTLSPKFPTTEHEKRVATQFPSDCVPIAQMFMDSPDVQEAARAAGLPLNGDAQYDFALVRPATRRCWGVAGTGPPPSGMLRNLYDIEPVPKRLLDRALWVVRGAREAVYLDASTGKVLHRLKIPY